MVLTSLASVAVVALGLGGAAPAAAVESVPVESLSPGSSFLQPILPESTLQLTMHENSGAVRSATLTCQPTGGTHRNRDAACATLTTANGDFTRITPRRQKCTMIYSPVDVTAVGTWRGTPVAFRTTYPNKCAADSQSASVFAF
ncbi:SSI family serine proteinase inhibitor [Amycolatopsis jejuensis]|uniref:SSI family serine proteinase inhibitor n=1 Tax=Amycolatopsis jejuensis TaxID=330084 RepID=UPI000A0644FF|nr:SSI family serine proteinase inhibitor [Amycolatopsis jejuensis]